MKDNSVIKVSGVKCLLCGDTVYSRSNYDFRRCFCGNVFVDAGPHIIHELNDYHYSRMGVVFPSTVKTVEIEIHEVSCTNLEEAIKYFHDDWNYRKNKLGLIRDKSFDDDTRIAAKAKVEILK